MHKEQVALIDGLFADPDIIYSLKYNKFYLYPTTDGIDNWGSSIFKCFSSKDLSSWKDEGVVLDLQSDVAWAKSMAWAPSVIERKLGEKYLYFFYFCAEKKIGVAFSESPVNGFKDKGTPLITEKYRPTEALNGQEIDPYVFHDKINDKYFIFWGNLYLARAELEDDMINIKENTIKYITPDKTFREAISVFVRNGIYYYLWSENDTRDPDYRIRYGFSYSLDGPIIIPTDNIVIQQYESRNIFATGHNDVINIPGSDEWYLFYHRFCMTGKEKWNECSGFQREVCRSQLLFNSDGTIKQIKFED